MRTVGYIIHASLKKLKTQKTLKENGQASKKLGIHVEFNNLLDNISHKSNVNTITSSDSKSELPILHSLNPKKKLFASVNKASMMRTLLQDSPKKYGLMQNIQRKYWNWQGYTYWRTMTCWYGSNVKKLKRFSKKNWSLTLCYLSYTLSWKFCKKLIIFYGKCSLKMLG